MSTMSVLTLVATFGCILTVLNADTAADAQRKLENIQETETGAKWCPAPKIGVECPTSSIFHFYRCCGDVLSDCCFQLQTWVVVVLIIVAVIFVASLILSLIRCLFCRRSS